LGYEGYVGCEYVPRNSTLAGLSWRDRLLNSRATLHAIHT
jgi:hydroxypyruvate isomerase